MKILFVRFYTTPKSETDKPDTRDYIVFAKNGRQAINIVREKFGFTQNDGWSAFSEPLMVAYEVGTVPQIIEAGSGRLI